MEAAPDWMSPSIIPAPVLARERSVTTWENLPTRLAETLNARTTLRPGEEVLLSGIYEGKHAGGQVENITLIRGGRFPECRECGNRLTYRLVREAPYIYEDPDFTP